MEFKKYMHIERFGTDEVEDIQVGECYVFYKIDGTNGSVWLDENGNIKTGSRTRELTLEKDNAGFYAYVLQNEKIKAYLKEHPNHRLYGEWLIKNSIKTYRDDAWKKFYIFDVSLEKEDHEELLPYEVYKGLLDRYELDYVPPMAILKNAKEEDFTNLLDKTGEFLVEEGKGNGEGIVIKNYAYRNKYGRQTWAKIVASEFKERHNKKKQAKIVESTDLIEEKIVNEFCTKAFIEKEYAKIFNEKGNWSSKYIQELLGRIYSEFIKEESWNIVKKFRNPTINYKTLNALVIQKVKETKQELFG